MHPIARPASRLIHARFTLHTTTAAAAAAAASNLQRWPAAALCLRYSVPPVAHRRLYSSLPPSPPQLPSSSASKDEIKQASATSDPSSNSSNSSSSSPPSSEASSETPESSPTSNSDFDPTTSTTNTSSSSSSSNDDPKSSSKDAPHDPLPDTATKIYTSLPPALSEKLSHLMDTLQTRLLTASTTLNHLTGYAAIEAIKHQNTLLESRLAAAQDLVRTARQTYKTTNAKRAATQREVTTLLARKESWTPSDLERFTQLYRQDHSLEQEVAAAAETLTDAEHAEQALGQELNAGILKRYHEEQIWSDRIRRASTWGTWGLMGVNVLLFIVLQFIAEPWKRRRLVRGVVEEEKAFLERVSVELAGLKAALLQKGEPGGTPATPALFVEETKPAAKPTGAEEVLTGESVGPAAKSELNREEKEAADNVAPLEASEETVFGFKSWRGFLADPALWKARLVDLYSERRIDLRMRDASLLALEGAAAGATLAGGLAFLLVRRN